MEEHAVLPDIYCPFPYRVNPYAEFVDGHTNTWVQEFGIISSEADLKRFKASRFPWLAAYVHPTVGYEELVLVSDLISWQFLLDNLFDGPLGKDPGQAQEALNEFASMLTPDEIIQPDIDKLIYPLMSLALHDVWKRIFPHGTPEWRHRFTRNMSAYIYANAWETHNRAERKIPDMASSMKNREQTIGMWPAMDMINVVEHLFLPTSLYEHPDFQTLLQATAIHVVLVNDLFSHRKEAAIADCNNLVIQLQALEHYNLQDAQNKVSAMIREETIRYMQAFTRLTTSYPEHASAIQQFAGNLQGWMRGNIDWSSETLRYNKEPIHNHIVMD